MRILITGGAGFIGTNVCHKLLEAGHDVVAVDNFITATRNNPNRFAGNKHFTFIEHDVTQPFEGLKDRLQHIDQIYHLACPTGVPNLVTLAEEMSLTCSIGTRNVLELARVHHAKYLLTSSSEAYGDPQISPQSEDYTGHVNPVGIRSPYEEGKRFAETLTAMYVRKYGIAGKIVRIFNTYGPYMSVDDTRVIPRFLTQALAGKLLTIHGNGEQKRTFCYVDDLVDGLLAVMEKGKAGEVYNLGSDHQMTITELAEKIIALTGSASEIQSVERPSHDHQSRMPDLSRAKSLGWSPKIPLDEGLQKTFSWLKDLPHQKSG